MSKPRLEFAIVISVIGLLALSTFSIGIGNTASPHSSHVALQGSEPSLKYAFFPREPRLQDVQPNSGYAQVGLASYGANGTTVNATGVQGIATIHSATIGSYSGTMINNSVATSFAGSGDATLQENSVALLGGGLGYFWAQNVAFVAQTGTNTFEIEMVNNIWNFNSLSSNMNSNIVRGTGSVSCFTTSGVQSCYYFAADPNNFTVTAPFTVNLTMWIGRDNTIGATDISFNYHINDSSGQVYTGTFDDAVLFPNNTRTPSFFRIGGETPYSGVLPGGTTTLTLPSDLEFVWGGPGGGSGVFMNSFSGREQLLISTGTNFAPAGDVYSVGSDTGETAAGITVSPDLSDPSSPAAILTSGYVNPVKLWPLTLSFGITPAYSGSALVLNGQLEYSALNGSSATPAPYIALTVFTAFPQLLGIAVSPQVISSNAEGSFSYTFNPSFGGGIFGLMFSYPGSAAFLPQNETEQIAVSSISLGSLGTSLPAASIAPLINSSSVYLGTSGDNFLIAVASGTTETVTFPSISVNVNSGRVLFSGFHASGSSAILGNTVVLSGSNAQNLDALFLNQYNVTISNPVTSTFSSGWYNQSQTIKLSAPSTVSKSGQTYSFSAWVVNGRTLNSSSASESITVNSPMQLVAEYANATPTIYSETSLVILIAASTLSILLGIGIGYYLRKPRPDSAV